MFLVDNFKIFLLVGLICAVGVPSADAQATKCWKDDKEEDCKVGADAEHGATPQCQADKAGKATGCMKMDDCKASSAEMYCCGEDNCNNLGDAGMKTKCMAATKELGYPPCKADDPKPSPTEKPPANSTATGMVPNYYGGIPVVAAVIPIFLVSLKSFS